MPYDNIPSVKQETYCDWSRQPLGKGIDLSEVPRGFYVMEPELIHWYIPITKHIRIHL